MAKESKPPDVDGASDYVAVFTPVTDLVPERVCLVIVDMQYATGTRTTGLGKRLAAQGKLQDAEYRFARIEDDVVPNTKRLLEFFRAHDLRRVFLTYGSEVSDYSDLPEHVRQLCEGTNNRVGEREHEIIDELKPLPDERVFNKIGASAFNSTAIDIVLRVYGVDTLLFVGVSTNMCVEGTVRDAADHDFLCFVVEDACGADSPAMHEASITVVQRLFAQITTTDEVIAHLEAKLSPERPKPVVEATA
jgi:nicotinamidase-related amidase